MKTNRGAKAGGRRVITPKNDFESRLFKRFEEYARESTDDRKTPSDRRI